MFYVYQYVDETGLPYYIGKGTGDRITAKHLFVEVPPPDRRIIIKNNLTESEALTLENSLIRHYGRKIDGGLLENIKINQWACLAGWKHSDEAKRKISEKNKGKLRTEAQKQNYRKPKSKSHAEKIRLANIGREPDGRYAKIKETMSKKRWYNDGSITKMFEPGNEPAGFSPGRLKLTRKNTNKEQK